MNLAFAPTERNHDPNTFGARDVDDLRWWFNWAEADMGVRSSQGAQQDALVRKNPHWRRFVPFDEQNDDAADAMPSTGYSRGPRLALDEYNHERQRKTACPACAPDEDCKHRRWDTPWDPPELMPVHESRSTVVADPYPDSILWSIKRGRKVRATLMRTDHNQVLLLNAVYGPTVGNRVDTMAIRKRLGDLCEIAVAMMAASRKEDDESARRMVVRKLTDESYITMAKRAAEKYLKAAHEAYVKARLGQ